MHDLAFEDEVKVPGAHGVGAVEPVAQELPAVQFAHAPAWSSPSWLEYVPAKHGRAADEPCGQKWPALHTIQVVAPRASWY